MTQLKVDFQRKGKTVVGRVVSMSDNLRGIDTVIHNKQYEIASRNCPALSHTGYPIRNVLMLRGLQKERDNEIFIEEYETEKQAEEAIKNFTNLIKKFNSNPNIIKPILTAEEKRYLEVVLHPFRDKITGISIYGFGQDQKYGSLQIHFDKEPWNSGQFRFPNFEIGTIYKGLTLRRTYTTKDLGLWK